MQLILNNLHNMLIMSAILAMSIDAYNWDKTREFELNYSDKVVLIHYIVFLVYQTIYLGSINWILSKNIHLSRKLLAMTALGNVILIIPVLCYNQNIWITHHRKSSATISENFEYTMKSQYYAIYVFIFHSVRLSWSLWFALGKKEEEVEKNEDDELIVLGTTYENCKWYMSWINTLSIYPLVFVLFIDTFFLMNSPAATGNPCSKTLVAAFHSFFFVIFQFVRSSIIASGNEFDHEIGWTKHEMIQFILSLVYLWNPFFVELGTNYDKFLSLYSYTRMYETVVVPMFLALMLVKAYVNYRMSRIVTYRKDRERAIWYQKSVKWEGLTCQEWYHILLFVQVIAILAIPVTWIIEKYQIDGFFDISEFWRIDQDGDDFFVLLSLIVLLWIQIIHASTFSYVAFMSFEEAFVIIVEGVLLILFSFCWFNPWLSLYQTGNKYLSIHFPDTSIAMTGSVFIFIIVQVWIILLMIEIDSADPDKVNEYEILDGEKQSSTKKEYHEHPIYLLRKQNRDTKKNN